MPQFIFDNEPEGMVNTVQWGTPGLTVVLESVGTMQQLIPASALGFFNGKVMAGHDASFQVAALQADGVTPFNLTGIGINFYAKANQADTTLVFSKSLANNVLDILVPNASTGLITVWVRAADYAGVTNRLDSFFCTSMYWTLVAIL